MLLVKAMKLRPLPMKVAISFVKAKSVLLGQFLSRVQLSS